MKFKMTNAGFQLNSISITFAEFRQLIFFVKVDKRLLGSDVAQWPLKRASWVRIKNCLHITAALQRAFNSGLQ